MSSVSLGNSTDEVSDEPRIFRSVTEHNYLHDFL